MAALATVAAPPRVPAAEGRHRQIPITAPVGIFWTDLAGACVFVNDRWSEFAGIPAAAALGSGWLQAVHPDDRDQVLAEWMAAVAERRAFHMEYRFQQPDGHVRWLSGYATPYPDARGGVGGYVGTVADISESVAVHDSLRNEARFIDAVIDVAGSLFCVLDRDGRFLRFNRACELLSGYRFEEIVGRALLDFLVPGSEIEAVRASLARLQAGEPPASNENHWLTRGGALRLISWSNVSIYDEAGELSHIVSTGIDITDERRTQHALRGVEEVGTLLAKEGPTPESMGATLRILGAEMGYRYLVLFIAEGDLLKVGAQIGYDGLAETFDPARGIIGRAYRSGSPSFVPDVTQDPDYVEGNPLVTSEVAVPLVAEGVTLGVLSIESTAELPLTVADYRLAQAVAERLSTALLLGRQQLALAERARVFTALTAFARIANSMLDSDRLAQALLDAVDAVIPAETTALVEIDPATGSFALRATRGPIAEAAVRTGHRMAIDPIGRAIGGQAIVIDRIERASFPEAMQGLVAVESFPVAAVPLIREGAVLGVFMLARTAGRGAFSDLELEIMPLMAAQTALALANAHLLEEISSLAIHDPLTGLYNRRHFDAAADLILARRKRQRKHRRPVAAVMFDLDSFGKFNKQHGHAAGDAVLREFAAILLARFRASDLVARYGGEEFVAILDDSTVEDALAVAEEVRASLDERRIASPDGIELHATVSAGCAGIDGAEPTREALLRKADAGLSMAKKAGRNRVVAA